VVQDELSKNAGIFGSILGSVASVVTEQADDRIWRMLPERVYVARAHLPPGEHKVIVDGRDFGPIKIDGQYAVVPLRFYESVALVGEIGTIGKLPEQEPPPPPAAAPVTSKAVSVKSTKKTSQSSAKKPEVQTKK
jgi:hypothetical protein